MSRRHLVPFIGKALESVEEGIVFPLKAEYERLNMTLEGSSSGGHVDALEWPAAAGDSLSRQELSKMEIGGMSHDAIGIECVWH